MSSTTGPHGPIALRVLLVDDEPIMRSAVRRILESPEVEIAEAEDGEAALALLRSREWQDRSTPVDVVISDFNMPQMDGRELLTVVGREFPPVVRILMTANKTAGEAMVRDGLAEFVMMKPVDMTEMLACLHAARLIVQYRQEEFLKRSS